MVLLKGYMSVSRFPMEEAVKKGTKIGKSILGGQIFYFRQRLYISNNFLQHFRSC